MSAALLMRKDDAKCLLFCCVEIIIWKNVCAGFIGVAGLVCVYSRAQANEASVSILLFERANAANESIVFALGKIWQVL